MIKKYSILLILFCLNSAYPAYQAHLRTIDEIKRLALQGKIGEVSEANATLESSSSLVLDLYNTINHALHYGQDTFSEHAKDEWRKIINRLLVKARFYQANPTKFTDFEPIDKAILNSLFACTGAIEPSGVDNRVFTKINEIKHLITTTPLAARNALIDIILSIYKDQPTQLEKSFGYHYTAASPRDKDSGAYKWDDATFKNWVWVKFSPPIVGTVKRPYTQLQSMQFFQDLLINEKLHPGYYVLYHAAGNESIGVQLFNCALAKLLQAKGASFSPRIYIKRDIGEQVVANGPFVIRNVDDVVNYMNRTSKFDTVEPVAKHLVSSSFSLFNHDVAYPSNVNALKFYTENTQYNVTGILKSVSETLTAFTTDAAVLASVPAAAPAGAPVSSYAAIICDKFERRQINGHGLQQPAYPKFSTLIQFFIKKNIVDSVVYFGGLSGARLSNKSGNNKIAEVLEAFLGPDVLTYYRDLHYAQATIRDCEYSKNMQGKIAVTSEAFFKGVGDNSIQLVIHNQAPQEFVVNDDLKFCFEQRLAEDFPKMLDSPTPSMQALFAHQFQGMVKPGGKQVQGFRVGSAVGTAAEGGILTDAYEYPTLMVDAAAIAPMQSPSEILATTPSITSTQLKDKLIAMLKPQQISEVAKQNIFVKEFLEVLIRQQKTPVAKNFMIGLMQEIFDDPESRLTSPEAKSLNVVELITALAAPTDDSLAEWGTELLKQVVDVLANKNTHMQVLRRVANDFERGQEFSMLRCIAFSFLLSKDPAYRQYVLNAFVPLLTGDPFYAHKVWCLASLSHYMNIFIQLQKGYISAIQNELRSVPPGTPAQQQQAQQKFKELHEKKQRLKAPKPSDNKEMLIEQIGGLEREVADITCKNVFKHLQLTKNLEMLNAQLLACEACYREFTTRESAYKASPEYASATAALKHKNKLKDYVSIGNFMNFINANITR